MSSKGLNGDLELLNEPFDRLEPAPLDFLSMVGNVLEVFLDVFVPFLLD